MCHNVPLGALNRFYKPVPLPSGWNSGVCLTVSVTVIYYLLCLLLFWMENRRGLSLIRHLYFFLSFGRCSYVSFIQLNSWWLRALLKGSTVATWQCWDDLDSWPSDQSSNILTKALTLLTYQGLHFYGRVKDLKPANTWPGRTRLWWRSWESRSFNWFNEMGSGGQAAELLDENSCRGKKVFVW